MPRLVYLSEQGQRRSIVVELLQQLAWILAKACQQIGVAFQTRMFRRNSHRSSNNNSVNQPMTLNHNFSWVIRPMHSVRGPGEDGFWKAQRNGRFYC